MGVVSELSDGDRKLLAAYIHYLVLALRSNERFSHAGRFLDVLTEGPRNPFMGAVLEMRDQLCSASAGGGGLALDALQPFVEVVRSPQTPAPITAVALQAFLQFLELRCGFVDREAVERIAAATIDAKLEVADTQSHEAVLGKIIEVLAECVRHPCGAALPGAHLLSILQACLRLALSGPPEPSELLRRTAEQAIQDIVSLIFTRVREALSAAEADPEGEAAMLVRNSGPVLLFVCRLVGCDSVRSLLTSFSAGAEVGEEAALSPLTPSTTIRTSRINLLGLQLAHWVLLLLQERLLHEACGPVRAIVTDVLPRALLKVARMRPLNIVVRCSLLTTIRLLASYAALHIQPQLLSFVLAVHLLPFQNSLTPPSMLSPLTATPPTPEGADFLSLHRDEDAELVLESLLEWCSEPHFAPFLCCYYDCSPLAPNAFELLCRLLALGTTETNPFGQHLLADLTDMATSAGALENPPRLNTLQLLCHEALMALLVTVAGRCGVALSATGAALRQQCLARRGQKAVLREFATQFGRKAAKAVAWLLAPERQPVVGPMGLETQPTGEALGQFLFFIGPLLDKTEIGLYISELGRNPADTPEDSACSAEELRERARTPGRTAFHEGVLRGFISAFDFRSVPILTALRRLLSTFKLPGEAQKIDRVVQAFADHWFASNGGVDLRDEAGVPLNPFTSADGPYVLAFSIIMLNTDRWSSQIQAKDKMQLSAWYANNRGINDGKDLPEAFLKAIFDAILACQIQMREPIFDAWDDEFLWSEVLREARERLGRARQDCPTPLSFATADPGLLGVLDREIFEGVWRPALTSCGRLLALAEALATAPPRTPALPEGRGLRPPQLVQRGLLGYQLCARVAHFHQMPHVLDGLVYSLCSLVIPLLPPPGRAGGQCLRIPLTLASARDFSRSVARSARALDACRALFAIVRAHGSAQREGWQPLVALIAHLYMAQLLPEQQVPLSYAQPGEEEFFFLSWTQTSPALHRRPIPDRPDHKAEDGGWLSFLGMGRPADGAETGAAKEVLECVRACGVSELLFHDSQLLETPALVALVTALIRSSGIPVTVPQTAAGATDSAASPPPTDPSPAAGAAPASARTPDPPAVTDVNVTVFCLHVMVDVAIANKDRFDVLAPYVDQTILTVLYGLRQALGQEEERTLRGPQPPERQGVLAYWLTIGEAAVLAALRLLTRLVPREAVHPYLARLLAVLGTLTPYLLTELVSRHFIDALYLMVSENTLGLVRARDHWELLLSLAVKCGLAAKKPESRRLTYHLLECVCNVGAFVWPDNVPTVVTALTQVFVRLEDAAARRASLDVVAGVDLTTNGHSPEPAAPPEPTVHIVSLLLALHSRLVQSAPGPLNLPAPGWCEAWMATLNGLALVVTQQPTFRGDCDALLALQRAALATELLQLPPTRILDLFGGVLLPLLGTLLDSPQPKPGPPPLVKLFGMLFSAPPAPPPQPSPAQSAVREDLQARSVGVLAKAVLHYLPVVAKAPQEFPLLWQRILISFGQFYGRGSPAVREAVLESTRNLVMVMATMCAVEAREAPEDQRVFQPYPRFWHLTIDLLLANFDFGEALAEAVRGTVAPAVPSVLQHRVSRNTASWPQISPPLPGAAGLPGAGRPAPPAALSSAPPTYAELLTQASPKAPAPDPLPVTPIVVELPPYPVSKGSLHSPRSEAAPLAPASPAGEAPGPAPAVGVAPAEPPAAGGDPPPVPASRMVDYWQEFYAQGKGPAPADAPGAGLPAEATAVASAEDVVPTHTVHPPAPLHSIPPSTMPPVAPLDASPALAVAPLPPPAPAASPTAAATSSPAWATVQQPPAPSRGVRLANAASTPSSSGSNLAPKLVPRR
eukprot:EG_transcript_148